MEKYFKGTDLLDESLIRNDSNVLIDKFYSENFKGQITNSISRPEQLIYHCDWSALMMVVEKIMKMETNVTITNFSCEIKTHLRGYNSTSVSEEGTIKAVWFAVIEFINWHNGNKSKSL